MGSKQNDQICTPEILLQYTVDNSLEKTNLHLARLNGEQLGELLQQSK